jgi:phosphoglycolate phosphatase-like HAD superfamily hydrolase
MHVIHCSGVLFDMDGVLVDSTPAIARFGPAGRSRTASFPKRSCTKPTAAPASKRFVNYSRMAITKPKTAKSNASKLRTLVTSSLFPARSAGL